MVPVRAEIPNYKRKGMARKAGGRHAAAAGKGAGRKEGRVEVAEVSVVRDFRYEVCVCREMENEHYPRDG